MSVAYINPEVLAWARGRAGLVPEELQSFHRKYVEWEQGTAKPTFRQAQELAKKLHVPFGFFYLSNPPKEEPLTVDLRTFSDARHHEFSLELRDVIADAKRKQEWYREYLLEGGAEPSDFVGKYKVSNGVNIVAEDISKALQLSFAEREGFTKQQFLGVLTDKAEQAGVLVLRNGKVGANTHRVLDVKEFRGFALPDDMAPLVFVNTADFEAAQIFTLMHELAHLWLGAEGVSDWGLNDRDDHHGTELFCNQVAVEVLVPQREFKAAWVDCAGTLEEKSARLSNRFKVSSVVIARRAWDLDFVNKTEFFAFYNLLRSRWKQKRSASDSGNFNNSFPVANSRILTDAICHAAASGELLIRDGARLLGVKPATFSNYAQKQGAM